MLPKHHPNFRILCCQEAYTVAAVAAVVDANLDNVVSVIVWAFGHIVRLEDVPDDRNDCYCRLVADMPAAVDGTDVWIEKGV